MTEENSGGFVAKSYNLDNIEEGGTLATNWAMESVSDDVAGENLLRKGFDLDLAPGHLIRRAQQVHTAAWAMIVGDDLTSPQFAVLNVLYSNPNIDQTMLSNCASLDTSTCQDIVSRLRRRGLIERSKDPSDGRKRRLCLSEKGKAMRDMVVPKVREVGELLLRSFSDRDRADFTRLLFEVANMDVTALRD